MLLLALEPRLLLDASVVSEFEATSSLTDSVSDTQKQLFNIHSSIEQKTEGEKVKFDIVSEKSGIPYFKWSLKNAPFTGQVNLQTTSGLKLYPGVFYHLPQGKTTIEAQFPENAHGKIELEFKARESFFGTDHAKNLLIDISPIPDTPFFEPAQATIDRNYLLMNEFVSLTLFKSKNDGKEVTTLIIEDIPEQLGVYTLKGKMLKNGDKIDYNIDRLDLRLSVKDTKPGNYSFSIRSIINNNEQILLSDKATFSLNVLKDETSWSMTAPVPEQSNTDIHEDTPNMLQQPGEEGVLIYFDSRKYQEGEDISFKLSFENKNIKYFKIFLEEPYIQNGFEIIDQDGKKELPGEVFYTVGSKDTQFTLKPNPHYDKKVVLKVISWDENMDVISKDYSEVAFQPIPNRPHITPQNLVVDQDYMKLNGYISFDVRIKDFSDQYPIYLQIDPALGKYQLRDEKGEIVLLSKLYLMSSEKMTFFLKIEEGFQGLCLFKIKTIFEINGEKVISNSKECNFIIQQSEREWEMFNDEDDLNDNQRNVVRQTIRSATPDEATNEQPIKDPTRKPPIIPKPEPTKKRDLKPKNTEAILKDTSFLQVFERGKTDQDIEFESSLFPQFNHEIVIKASEGQSDIFYRTDLFDYIADENEDVIVKNTKNNSEQKNLKQFVQKLLIPFKIILLDTTKTASEEVIEKNHRLFSDQIEQMRILKKNEIAKLISLF